MPDIFDTNDVSDLPEELRKVVAEPTGVARRQKYGSKYESLLREAKRPLSVRQMVAALWRKDGCGPRHTQTVYNALKPLVEAGRIVRVGDGTYTLPEHAKAAE